jgi:hypothetical protein
LLDLPAAERTQLREEAQLMPAEAFESAGLLAGALAWAERGESCRPRIYDLRGLDAERAQQRRRKDPEAASHLRSAVRNGCTDLVLELALRPELYDLEVARSLNPEQRAALDRGLVIALGGARGAAVVGYLGSRIADQNASLSLRRRALESFGRVAGPAGTDQLRGIADDPGSPTELRAGALVGLGLGLDPAAMPSLTAALRHPDAQVASAALVGLSTLAGPDNARASDAFRRQVSGMLVSLFGEFSPERSLGVVDALAYVAHPSVSDDLSRLRGATVLDGRLEAAQRRLRRALERPAQTGPAIEPRGPKTPTVGTR